jgi:hypothetical protein
MIRHVSDDDLARYAEGDLRPRKASRVASHLDGCPYCSERVGEFQALPNMLASVSFPPIPAHLSSRIEMALAGESAARLAGEPSAEAGRRDLPARARPTARRGWQFPGLTSPVALRTLAATGAAVLVAGGGYEIFSHVGGGSSGPSESIVTPAAAPKTTQLRAGPNVTYHHSGHSNSIDSVQSGLNFRSSTLVPQVEAALAAQQQRHASNTPDLGATFSAGQANSGSAAVPAQALRGCVNRIAAGRKVLLVDIARYQGKPATIIVIQPDGSHQAEIYVVGTACSASGSDIVAQRGWHR